MGRCGRGFDGRARRRIHSLGAAFATRALGVALCLPAGTTLGIPRLSVRSEAIRVGADGLALALGARRQRLAIGTQARLARLARLARRTVLARRTRLARLLRQRLPIRSEPRLVRDRLTVRTHALLATEARVRTTTTTTIATATTGTTAIAAITAGTATGTTTATRTTRSAAIVAITTGTTATTARTTGATTTEVARCGRQLPADSGARHLATTGTIIVLRRFLRCAELQASKAAWLVAIAAWTAEAAATTAATAAATGSTATAIAATATTASTAAIIVAAAPARLTGDAIDHVMKLAARDRAVRTLLALIDAHLADLVDPVADDVERLEQTRGAIGLNTERGRDRFDRRIGRARCGLATFARSGIACSGLGAFARSGVARSGLGAFARSSVARSGLGAFARSVARRIHRCVGRCIGGRVGRRIGVLAVARRRFATGVVTLSPRRTTGGCPCGSCPAKGERRELGERLHGG